MLSETTFGERLLRLRREKGLSQEALAEMLDTTRQAVSKWENGQGMPEAEKLLVLSDVFGVPVDGLLRDGGSCEKTPGGSPGFYVSREKAESWLCYESAMTKRIGLGAFVLLLVPMLFLLLPGGGPLLGALCAAAAATGLGIVLAACLNDKEYQYRALKQNPLIFDPRYLTELRGRSEQMKKRYVRRILCSVGALFAGGAALAALRGHAGLLRACGAGYALVAAGAAVTLFHSFSMIDAYELLAENERWTGSLAYRLLWGRKKKPGAEQAGDR
ncbi:helix-turn-helix transcriptional regulator [Anaerofilum sp. BX8]|uniref:Helix-turn-helix transcriptional regulator n=1 Tax=Anaerofilum hominis TaxID=2763016 RepID=A0A923IEC5_9FIRM|nr:helix-turn-helix transcriptional regulator [Anaerofilum hominis]MBC5581715.1 helix-turn-helix transcriptional regulator [Anaerofilum hominis]